MPIRNKFLKIGDTGFSEEDNGVVISSGSADGTRLVSTDSNGKLDPSLMPAGLGADRILLTAGEAISAGNLLYITSTGTVMKADGSNKLKACIGFSQDNALINDPILIYFEGSIQGLVGLTPGGRYYLSNTSPGGVTTNVITTPGHILQYIGNATTSTSISFEVDDPRVRA